MVGSKKPTGPTRLPLLVIVGPTASGKTALAIELAEKYNGEIICADSRTVYKGLDIGTAKPTAEEQTRVPHHLLDLVSPDQPFTVADFKKLANIAIDEIVSRGKLPILVGGSGLYIDSVLFNYSFAPVTAERDKTNPRHVGSVAAHSRQPLRQNTLVLGLEVSREVLKQRIAERIETMLGFGLIKEVSQLLSKYPQSKAVQSTGYRAFGEHIKGQLDLEQAKALFIKNDFQLARRQMTWFRRNKSIHWINNTDEAVEILTTFLNKKQ